MLGETVRRATGRELPELMAERIFGPLGMRDSHLGLPASQLDRAVPVVVEAPGQWAVTRLLNSPAVRQAVIPSGGVSSTAEDLARFYRAMLAGGELDGIRVLDHAPVGGRAERGLRLAEGRLSQVQLISQLDVADLWVGVEDQLDGEFAGVRGVQSH